MRWCYGACSVLVCIVCPLSMRYFQHSSYNSHSVAAKIVTSTDVAGFSKAALDFGLSAGLSVSGLYGPLKGWRERQLAKIFASGETLRLQFPKEDLGFVYNSKGAAVCLDSPGSHQSLAAQHPQHHGSGNDGTAVNTKERSHRQGTGSIGGSDRQYRPSCSPGGRMPHCTLQPLKTGQH